MANSDLDIFDNKKIYLTTVQKRNIQRYIFELKLLGRFEELKKELKPIIESSIQPKEKGEKIYKLIHSFRYPILSSTRQRFMKEASILKKLIGCDFSPPVNFEGNDIEIKFKIHTPAELQYKLKLLLKHKKAIKKLFSVFTGNI